MLENERFEGGDEGGSGETVRLRKRPIELGAPSSSVDLDFTIGSDVENGEIQRKASKVTLNENLTVFCDDGYAKDGEEEDEDGERQRLLREDSRQVRSATTGPPLNFFSYFWEELTRGYSLENEHLRYTEKRRKVYAFLRIPVELERFLFYGFLQCVDAFTYLFTFLPIRFFMSFCSAFVRLRAWNTAETCDFLKVGIITLSLLLMSFVDTSFVYHQVRGQGVIKLYIFYNMLEVADKLFSSFGQDVLDALFWTANEVGPRRFRWPRTILHFFFAVCYATLHTFLVLLQATTLNVAFNSHSQALLAIMMSNNFVELKGAVFKKFAKPNLFQMACSDVRERFHIMVLLTVVVLRNLMAVNWNFEHLWEMQYDLMMVVFAELLVDWLKHCFITKFNEINAEVYKDFTITIAYDVVRSRDATAFSDYSDQVSRRMGFIPIPLSIMLLRVIWQTFNFQGTFSWVLLVLVWLCLLAVKLLNGIVLLGMACQHVTEYQELQAKIESDYYRRRLLTKKSKSAPSSPRISLLDFHDVCHQTTTGGGFTASDLLQELNRTPAPWIAAAGARNSSPPLGTPVAASTIDERTPRRTQSLAHLPRRKRDKSEPPGSIPEGEEALKAEVETDEQPAQVSPTRRSKNECESLSEIQAYTMLEPDQGMQRIDT